MLNLILLMLASTEAGLVRPIGALFHIFHGISNVVLLCDCMKFVCTGNQERFAEVARAMANKPEGFAKEYGIY